MLSLRKKRGITSVRARCEEERLRPGHKYLGTYPCDRIRPLKQPLKPRQRGGAEAAEAAAAKGGGRRKPKPGLKGKGRGKGGGGQRRLTGVDGEGGLGEGPAAAALAGLWSPRVEDFRLPAPGDADADADA